MSVELSNDDRCVVDLLLERGQSPAGASLCFSSSSSTNIQNRIERVDRVLRLLDHLPVGEPSPDLAARTLERCADERSPIQSSAPIGAVIARSQM